MTSVHPHDPSTLTLSRASGNAGEALEVSVYWADTVLAVREMRPPRAFTIGDGSEACDFVVPSELAGDARRTLVEVVADSIAVIDAHGVERPLALGEATFVQYGQLGFRVERSTAQPGGFARRKLDATLAGFFGASLFSVSALVGVLAYLVPPLGLTDDENSERDRLVMMQQYLAAQAERERDHEPNPGERAGSDEARSAPREASRGASGEAGKPTAERRNLRRASNAPLAERDTTATRAELVEQAKNFGMIGLLSTLASAQPSALWELDGTTDPRDAIAFGNLFDGGIGDSRGTGGLGVSGTNEGSGGRGIGVGIDGVGTCGNVAGCGPGDGGWARSNALTSRGHATTSPRIRPGGDTTVSGRLPPEVIQRVVRMNFGRFRQCYEGGLVRNPSLTGRVAARFLIDRSGVVLSARNGGSDLPDSAVVACVVSSFYGLSFPAPDNGVVQVTYPIFFSVG